MSAGLDGAGLGRVHDALAAHVETGQVPGLVALLSRGDVAPLRRDAIFRIASLTKPIAAAGATSFSVPPEKQARFTTSYMPDGAGGLTVLDPPAGGWWSTPQAMANAAGMLVSTLDDFWAFVAMLVAGGRHDGR